MKMKQKSGYKEIEVTADKAIEVWAPSIEDLFAIAAEGMLEIGGVRTDKSSLVKKQIELEGFDLETLLITFLEEIAYFLESDSVAFKCGQIQISNTSLSAALIGKKVVGIDHEIKAITFNNLKITEHDGLFHVTIVFDL
jgi:SHS2 domain-containing protein